MYFLFINNAVGEMQQQYLKEKPFFLNVFKTSSNTDFIVAESDEFFLLLLKRTSKSFLFTILIILFESVLTKTLLNIPASRAAVILY